MVLPDHGQVTQLRGHSIVALAGKMSEAGLVFSFGGFKLTIQKCD